MKRRKAAAALLAALLVCGMAVTSVSAAMLITRPEITVETPAAGATQEELAAFEKTFEAPHYDWEKAADGVYVGGIKVPETGYYRYTATTAESTYGTLETGSEDAYNLYVNLEEKAITLNGIEICVNAGEVPYIKDAYIEKYPNQYLEYMVDGATGVPGVLVLEEGTYYRRGSGAGRFNWDSRYYWALGYNNDFSFAAVGLGILSDGTTDADGWNLTLLGENTITVNSAFAHPSRRFQDDRTGDRNFYYDAGVYGVYSEGALTVAGEGGSLTATANSKWDITQSYNEDNATAAGLWATGDLTIESGTITAASSSTRFTHPQLGVTMTLINTAGTIGSGGVLTIADGDIKATNYSDYSAALRGTTGVVIQGGTVTASSEGSGQVAGIAAGESSRFGTWNEGYVNITGGDVTAAATLNNDAIKLYQASVEAGEVDDALPAYGIAVGGAYDVEEGDSFGITISNATVDASGVGAGLYADDSIVTVASDATVTAETTLPDCVTNAAVTGTLVSLSAGTYNTPLPPSYVAEDYGAVNGTIRPVDEITNWTARLGSSIYYTEENGADLAIAAADATYGVADGKEVWLRTSSALGKSGLSLGDNLTIYVAEGCSYTGTLRGDRLLVEVTEGAPVVESGVTFTPYTYTMVADPQYAGVKVVRAGEADKYFFELGNGYSANTALTYTEDGDRVVLLSALTLGSTPAAITKFITLDLNGQTLESSAVLGTVFTANRSDDTGTVVITDSDSEQKGTIVNTGNGAAVFSSSANVHTVIDSGTYQNKETASWGVAYIRNGEITGGTFTGAAISGTADTFTVSGGTFSKDPSAFLAASYEVYETADGMFAVRSAAAASISVEFRSVTAADAEGEMVYEIIAKANDATVINELAAADLTFAFTTDDGVRTEVRAADSFAVSNVSGTDRYLFHYDGINAFEGTANEIALGTVTVTGYGAFTLAMANAETNVVNATTTADNLVASYTQAGAADADDTTGALILNTDSVADDGMSGTVSGAIAVPTRTLTVALTFPNAIAYNAAAYQDMTVTISGGAVNETIALGAEETYTLTRDLPYHTSYTVTVTGAGYRTVRRSVLMNADKTLRFWNNVTDTPQEVEVGTASSAANTTFLAGDILMDNQINIYDLSAVVSYFGRTGLNTDGLASDYTQYDLNRDGKIDARDVAMVLVSWGN